MGTKINLMTDIKDYNMNDECAAVFIPKGYYLFEEGKPWPTQVKTKDFNAFDIFKPIILDKDGKDAYDKISSHRRPFNTLYLTAPRFSWHNWQHPLRGLQHKCLCVGLRPIRHQSCQDNRV